MRALSKAIVTGVGIAAISLTAVGISSAEQANPAVAATTKGVVTSLTTTHTHPLLSAPLTATLHKGTPVEARCWVNGQVVGGSDKWFMLAGGLGFGPRAAIQLDSAVPACV
ncbi:hypothetical protein ACVBEQ_07260 [Nakamurella sp. GG22]